MKKPKNRIGGRMDLNIMFRMRMKVVENDIIVKYVMVEFSVE